MSRLPARSPSSASLGLAESIVSGSDPVNGIEARQVAQMNCGAVVPVLSVSLHPCAELVLAHAAALLRRRRALPAFRTMRGSPWRAHSLKGRAFAAAGIR